MVNLTNGLAEYRMGRKRKRPRREEHAGGRATPKKRKGDITSDPIDTDIPESLPGALTVPPLSGAPNTNDTADFGSSVPVPSILRHLTTGINEVTRKLEAQIQSSRQTVVVSDKDVISSEAMSQPRIKVVFVCRADIDPPILIDHIPHLITACNSSARFTDLVKLVPLPKGAEFTLAEAMGLRRVAVVAVDVRFLSNDCGYTDVFINLILERRTGVVYLQFVARVCSNLDSPMVVIFHSGNNNQATRPCFYSYQTNTHFCA